MNHSTSSDALDAEHSYPLSDDHATLSLQSILLSHIKSQGPLPFDQWMSQCLYHPTYGYYTNGDERVGKSGDFFTSVSVGSLFGKILTYRIAEFIKTHAEQDFTIIETGGNTGQLAYDILESLAADFPELYAHCNYTICEPLSQMRAKQATLLQKHHNKISHISQIRRNTSENELGIILSNELIDAFPTKLITLKNSEWLERHVSYQSNNFCWHDQPILNSTLKSFADSLSGYPNNYTTEYRLGTQEFVAQCAKPFTHSLCITIDYGYTDSDLYHPSRTTGSLRCYSRHTADEDPLTEPGNKDITAHVNFSMLAAQMKEHGLEPQTFESQSRYLTLHSKALLKQFEKENPIEISNWIRQFQTLTHPSMMGQRFHILECIKGAIPQPAVLEKLELTTSE